MAHEVDNVQPADLGGNLEVSRVASTHRTVLDFVSMKLKERSIYLIA